MSRLIKLLDETPKLMIYMDHLRFTACRVLVLDKKNLSEEEKSRTNLPYCLRSTFLPLSTPWQAREGDLTILEKRIKVDKPIYLEPGTFRAEEL